MSNLLAVDAGGTSSRAAILDRSGRCLGYGRAGGGNPISSGPALAGAAVAAATRDAIASMHTDDASSDDPSSDVAAIAMAGALTYTSTEWITEALAEVGMTATVTIFSDLLATFCSGGPETDGYAIVAGTGAAAVRVADGRIVGTADGLGWLLGDAGSGFWIGHHVVLEAVAALDGRAPATALSELLLAELGIPDGSERTEDGRRASLATAMDRLYELRPVQLARFAPLAFAGAEAGDAAAARILLEAERSITETLGAVTTDAVQGPVVLGGGVLARMSALPEQIAASQRALGHVPDVRRVEDGMVGAAVLALRAASVTVTPEIFGTVVETLSSLRAG